MGLAKFDRYMLSQLLVLFGFFSLILVSVYWVNRAIRLFDHLISDGQSALVFLELTALTLPYIILMVLPVSAFVAAVYTTNRLSTESEMITLQTAGASPWRIARPVLYFGAIVALLSAMLAHVLVPIARAELSGRSQEISRDITARFLKEGQFLHPSEDVSVFIGQISNIGELKELFLEDRRNDKAVITYTAERAFLIRSDEGPKLVMRDGMAQTFDPKTQRLSTVRFDDFSYNIGALLDNEEERPRDLRELPTLVLLAPSAQDLASANGTRADFLFEGHERFSRSLLALVLPVMGFAALLTGTFSRFGVWRQVIVAIVLVILVQLIANLAENAARRNETLCWLAYLAPVCGGLLAAVMILASGTNRFRKNPSSAGAT